MGAATTKEEKQGSTCNTGNRSHRIRCLSLVLFFGACFPEGNITCKQATERGDLMEHKAFHLPGCTCDACKAEARTLIEIYLETNDLPQWKEDRIWSAYRKFVRRTGKSPLGRLAPEEPVPNCSCNGTGTCARCELDVWLNSPEYTQAEGDIRRVERQYTQELMRESLRSTRDALQRMMWQLDPNVRCRCPHGCTCAACLKCRFASGQATEEDLAFLVQLKKLLWMANQVTYRR